MNILSVAITIIVATKMPIIGVEYVNVLVSTKLRGLMIFNSVFSFAKLIFIVSSCSFKIFSHEFQKLSISSLSTEIDSWIRSSIPFYFPLLTIEKGKLWRMCVFLNVYHKLYKFGDNWFQLGLWYFIDPLTIGLVHTTYIRVGVFLYTMKVAEFSVVT